ncbi:fumarate hydratase subunit alpha [Hypnocyclicus thermotrophus]|uniref:Fumarate hydratase subunit alpha n=1 Tax=Hypnocyclicus thermotrophus TaxID=1627895 RepID=A0AA46DXT9_9FUSO|nr:fumarate hydratase [Hypnocyclicus thermotrophus]TDT69128.1 fumarate hydratase subunit alpha [Hypnocyclicus thermotrophus]
MRKIEKKLIIEEVAKLCVDANHNIPLDVISKLKISKDNEKNKLGKNVLEEIIKNDEIASREKMAMCQDTGLAVVFLEIGREIYFDFDIYEAINEGVKKGYSEGYLRKSIVRSPIFRENTKTNTPAVIHTKLVAGDKLKIIFAPKGGGSENMSTVKMMKPSDGIGGIKNFVIDFVKNAGGNPCPPIIVGIGIGGNFEKSAILAKEALFRKIDDINEDKELAKIENELLEEINKLNIGPMGFGGDTTALAVKIKSHPCHIASMPVAININCHAARHKERII